MKRSWRGEKGLAAGGGRWEVEEGCRRRATGLVLWRETKRILRRQREKKLDAAVKDERR